MRGGSEASLFTAGPRRMLFPPCSLTPSGMFLPPCRRRCVQPSMQLLKRAFNLEHTEPELSHPLPRPAPMRQIACGDATSGVLLSWRICNGSFSFSLGARKEDRREVACAKSSVYRKQRKGGPSQLLNSMHRCCPS